MIISGNLLIADADGTCRLEPGTIRVIGDQIAEIQWGDISGHADFGGIEYLITPGFVDTHLHLPQFDLIGAHGMPLLQWLSQFTFPAEAKWADASYAEEMTRRVAQQLLRHGTTAIGAYATVHHLATRRALEVLDAMGFHGFAGQVLMDREAPDELCRGSIQLLAEAAQLQQDFPSSRTGMSAAITPRFAITCTPELLAGAGKLATETDAFVQTHLAETLAECDAVKQLFSNKSYVSVYQESGLLTSKTIYGHGIHLNGDDRHQIADANAVIAHCPTANSFLRSGTMQRQQWLHDRLRISLGSDIGAGYERSMVRVGRAMIEAAALIGDSFPSAGEAWYAITKGNADTLGLDCVGTIEVGSSADLVIARPDIAWLDSDTDPLSMTMFAWDDRWIDEVILRGKAKLDTSR